MNRKRAAAVVALAVIIATGIWLWRRNAGAGEAAQRASGTVEATEARLGFQIPGRIASIAVREGQSVAAGAVLATLDRSEMEARRGQALARVSAAESLVTELERGSRSEEIGQAEAAMKAAQERLADARRDLERNRRLYQGGAISQESYQKSATAAEVAEAQAALAAEQLALVRKGPRQERIAAQRAQAAEAREAVRAADASLANTNIVAPMAGVVTIRHHEPNEIVGAGEPVVTLMNPADRWVRIYVPENRIGAVRLGTSASISSDTYPDRRYRGRVVYISPEAEFTPKSVQTAEERVRLVYAVKVRIEGDGKMELKPGMPADVVLDGHQP
jgi:HlyD family secretion protein